MSGMSEADHGIMMMYMMPTVNIFVPLLHYLNIYYD